MKLLHHRYLRRLVTMSVVFGAFVGIVTTLPLWALGAAAISYRIPGRMRPLRLLWFLVVYLGLQVSGLVAAGALWVATGFGRGFARLDVREVHYRLLASLLRILMRTAQRVFKLRIAVEAPALPDSELDTGRDPRPLLVFSRHAGPGDSFLLVHELLSVYGRRPRIVLKNTLQWDPLIDLLLNRVPTRFISPNPTAGGVAESIRILASDMTAEDALVIFPEGGNYTEGRRLRAIERLDKGGDAALAERARAMRHLMAPRPGGVFAAIDGAPTADVVFVAHTGLEQLSSLRDLWRGLPMDADVRARFWTVHAEEIPQGRAERSDWLYDWWETMNAWVEESH